MEPIFKKEGVICPTCGGEGVMMEHDEGSYVLWCELGHIMVRRSDKEEPMLVYDFGRT